MKLAAEIHYWKTPAVDMWRDLSPLGRLFLFLPACAFLYALVIVLTPCVAISDWADRQPFVKWIDRSLKRLFLK